MVVVSKCRGIFLISIKDQALRLEELCFAAEADSSSSGMRCSASPKREKEREFLELQSLSSNELASWRSVQFLWALLYPFTWLTYSSPPVQSAGPVLVPRSSVCSSPLFRRLLFHQPVLGAVIISLSNARLGAALVKGWESDPT